MEIDICILMAGEGKRLRPLTNKIPKALLNINDDLKIIDHLLSIFETKNEIKRIIPIIGHGYEAVVDYFNNTSTSLDIQIVYNPFYSCSGPIGSLWVALPEFDKNNRSLLIINGDTIVSQELIDRFLDKIKELSPDFALGISETKSFTEDDMKVKVDRFNSHIIDVGKNLTLDESIKKSTGLFLINNNSAKRLFSNLLCEYVKDKNNVKKTTSWHSIINEIRKKSKVYSIYCEDKNWKEFDLHIDMRLFRRLFTDHD